MTRQINVETLHPQTRMLSDEQIQAIHHSSLDILSQTGIIMKNKRAEALLLEAGARKMGDRIKIPANLVQNALLTAPSRIPMHTRTGVLSMPLESGKVFFGTGSDTNFTIDLETGERRTVLQKDVQAFRALMRWAGEYRFHHVDGRLIRCRTHASLYPWDRGDAQRLGQADCLHRQ